MTLAILDQQFELLRRIDRSPRAQIYLASDCRGQRWIVKFIMDPDHFFDELARHYTLGEVKGVCRLQRNYPPYLASGNPFLFEPDLLRLFEEELSHDRNGRLSAETMHASPLARVGALVLEYVPGVPLRDVIVELDGPDQIAHLLGLAQVIAELHGRGEYHGDLSSDNVMMDTANGDVRLVGIGTGSSLQGEPGESPGWQGDVHTFAHHYLMVLDSPSPKLRALIAACMHSDPSQRPGMADIITRLIREGTTPAKLPQLLGASAVAALLVIALLIFKRPMEPTQYTQSDQSVSQPRASALLGKTFHDPQLGPFCDYLSKAIHIRIHYPAHLKDLQLPSFTLESNNWQTVLKNLSLEWRKEYEDGEPVIHILAPKS